MITFQKDLTATKYPGYYWDTKAKKLYSIKIGGELKELKKRFPKKFLRRKSPKRIKDYFYYVVSYKGRRRCLICTFLNNLKIKNSEIPFKKEI